jgi:hypothetical protein
MSSRSTPAGVNENIANLLLAAKFGVLVCSHAGGVGLCEIVQHLSMFDYVALSGTTQGRLLEWIDHLHEHFAAPAVVTGGRYRATGAGGVHREPAGVAGRVNLPVRPRVARRDALTADVGPHIFGPLISGGPPIGGSPMRGQRGAGLPCAVSEEEAAGTLAAAWAAGIRAFDTAPHCGAGRRV